jgi:N-acetylmuramoyl-L-alanine amidase
MKLCIDPGHGMGNKGAGAYDPGAQAAGVSEADVNLAWALTLKWVLEQAGISCWLTRDDDRDQDPVSTRAARAQAAGCSRFLSIHCNAGNGSASGVETYCRDAEDRQWASIVQACAVKATGLSDRGVRPESETAVGRLAVMGFHGPCALVELGYLDSKRDRQRLLSRECRLAFAQALAVSLKKL